VRVSNLLSVTLSFNIRSGKNKSRFNCQLYVDLPLTDEVIYIANRQLFDILTNSSLVEANQMLLVIVLSSNSFTPTSIDARWKTSFGLNHAFSDPKTVICNPSTKGDAIAAIPTTLTHMFHSEVLAAEQLGIGYLIGIRILMHPSIIKFLT
jgi:hypothetical protein